MNNTLVTEKEAINYLQSFRGRKWLSGDETKKLSEAMDAITNHVHLFRDLMNVYVEGKIAANKFTESTAKNYRYMYGKYMGGLGDMEIGVVAMRSTLIKWKNQLLADESVKDTTKQRVINQMFALINYGYFSKQVSEDEWKDARLILDAPKCYKTLETEKRNRVVWTKDEIKNFISVLPTSVKEMDRVMFRILLATGMRIGELLALKATSFDFENDMIVISCQIEQNREFVLCQNQMC